MNQDDKKFLGFHLACRLEDYEKLCKRNGNPKQMIEQVQRLEKLIYTEFIPESWTGPIPEYWKKII